ncbi:bifunctional YncE family protein/alkaline phosphatase family protein [Niabella drilacis]|uniref:40-residue YVTN family beta-propeller repeat-containing protein n=1 Tax=Niabella drilacis (strain DSM 25811 / CCM 8410 / CCUG 62505 / LMG 26954 / E90) TaxID=1285928 RepID=A0A1G6KMY9_NIADE|nr:bifunctional YncE family protein/alkaline phosphatase family protein [Niabella drilacis]SDC31885.1 40-residue YVTN family beta-propeller repeat-containing protein [Niabella drilacis]
MNPVSRFFAAIALAVMIVPGFSQPRVERDKILLPNGWSLTPAGTHLPLGDLPLNLVISNSGHLAAVTNNGQSTQTLDLVDLVARKRADSIVIAKSWYGLAFSSNDRYLYASGGHDNVVKRYAIQNNHLALKDSFVLGEKWPNRIGTAGLDVDDKTSNQLFVVTREDSSLYIFDLATRKIKSKTGLGSEAYTCKLSPDRKKLYISVWGGGKLLVWDVAAQKITASIATGNHPNEICISKNGKLLYVANANDNSVSVIHTVTNRVIETLNAALYPNAPSGSTSNGVALSADGKTLYVANADNNCLAVFDVSVPSKSVSKGFIPVGWYPTNVKVAGKQILVTNGKGMSSMANPYGPNPVNKKEVVLRHAGDSRRPAQVQYIAGLFRGTLSFINTPAPAQLAVYSHAVYQNTPYSKDRELTAQGEEGNPVPMKVGAASPIKHVFYVIKENRTYDQVLGDVTRGNGDSSLCLFGETITPNQHKIVSNFVLLDNFYVDAEVSADGHNWSMGAYATDYLEKTWPSSYGGRGGTYGGEGERKIANNRDGFIWDHAARNRVSFRTYGEFVDNGKAKLDVLKGRFAPGYTGYDLGVADTTRFRQWKHDFDSLVAANALPQLTTLRFGNDHTEGMRAGRKTPFAHVADNDLAVGMFVDYISKSPIWKECAIFILEDDAQNGPDHVDAHRSTAYVISPYVKRRAVDHTMYSTSGMLHTIELILGMPPMTQYDAAATPLWRCFTATPDYTAFDHVPATINLLERNPAQGKLAVWSEQFDWSKEDAVPDLVFNDILWMGIRGTPAPSPVRAAFLKFPEKKKKADDDD